jgi:hypothetical protein
MVEWEQPSVLTQAIQYAFNLGISPAATEPNAPFLPIASSTFIPKGWLTTGEEVI